MPIEQQRKEALEIAKEIEALMDEQLTGGVITMNYKPNILDSLGKSLAEAKGALEYSRNKLAKADKEFISAYHRIEQDDITEANGFQYASEFKEILVRRRELKGEFIISEKVYEAAVSSFEEINAVYQRAVNIHNHVSTRQIK